MWTVIKQMQFNFIKNIDIKISVDKRGRINAKFSNFRLFI